MQRHRTLLTALAVHLAGCAPQEPLPPYPGPCAVYETTGSGTTVIEETAWAKDRPLHRREFQAGHLQRVWTWRDDGRTEHLTSIEYDEPNPPLEWARTRVRDADVWVREEMDLNRDGSIDGVRTRSFARGRLREETHIRAGRTLSVTVHEARGPLVTESVRMWNVGPWDVTVTRRDERARIVEQTVDLGADGVHDRLEATVWGARGRQSWSIDADGDGQPEVLGWRSPRGCAYDELEDLSGDGVADRTRTYDCAGNLMAADFPLDRRTLHYSYSCF